ncbi:UNVERIFIED_CONTAM: hypothetical protein GTU68_003680 [Idotea baltica]|nr:hypothetical protein [Idotea baltica]
MFTAITEQGVIGRALQHDNLKLVVHNPRDFTSDERRTVDDRPYGGGPGMLMTPEPISQAIEVAQTALNVKSCKPKVVYLSPQGQRFDHAAAKRFAEEDSLILLAGRYEGVDERVLQNSVDEEWSIGDYVLSGGELAAMVMIDAIARLLPDSLGNQESALQDSFAEGLLDCPHYTRPESFRDQKVPDVLLSGDHKAIQRWRLEQSLRRTLLSRPDLLEKIDLTDEQIELLEQIKREL